MAHEQQRHIVIVGGGIIGCTTAYFLTRHPLFNPALHKITIVEAQAIASGASGKAGGLLALWAYPACIVPLSFKLHAELAKEHNGAERWGYRTLHVGSIRAKGKVYGAAVKGEEKFGGEEWQKLPKTKNRGKTLASIPKDLDWFDTDCIKGYSEMGTPETTAQVHPYLFTTSIFQLAVEAGVNIIYGSVTAIDSFDNAVKGVTYEEKGTRHIKTLPASDIVLAAGPWTSHVFPEAPIDAIRAHSVVIKADVSPWAVFTEIDLPKDFGRKTEDGAKKRRHALNVNPEMYARPDGTVYACGEGDTDVPLPKTSDLVICDDDRCQDIVDYISSISTPLRAGEVLVKQACYLPHLSAGGGPLIGETGIKGLWMASGHTCWGIQNSCATGKLMSEFIFEGAAKSARIESLDPRRFL
ncbi:FAD dependent oxidoreductase [Hyaloscypha variabilis F]|uniref:FAD dependent oxidoreductase n=1 Tax=Hyaloscypha variabilis (strain UAMH 11265 / GT02V1 / F) TaxID=1149755 RepID=A0A2J6QSE1_HYAVF|nr:FAD dependent oxidoreductase [Hyaloscypha variabilis F]